MLEPRIGSTRCRLRAFVHPRSARAFATSQKRERWPRTCAHGLRITTSAVHVS